ncbi:hypothetical protein Si088_01841 [Streptococcus infantarius subsp. infantarius]|nr:hypothetical protein [Streptococcus infantarius subsp. infantarius]
MVVSDDSKRFQVTLRKKTFEKLEQCSDWKSMSKSHIIEAALIDYLEKNGFYDDDEDRLLIL